MDRIGPAVVEHVDPRVGRQLAANRCSTPRSRSGPPRARTISAFWSQSTTSRGATLGRRIDVGDLLVGVGVALAHEAAAQHADAELFAIGADCLERHVARSCGFLMLATRTRWLASGLTHVASPRENRLSAWQVSCSDPSSRLSWPSFADSSANKSRQCLLRPADRGLQVLQLERPGLRAVGQVGRGLGEHGLGPGLFQVPGQAVARRRGCRWK